MPTQAKPGDDLRALIRDVQNKGNAVELAADVIRIETETFTVDVDGSSFELPVEGLPEDARDGDTLTILIMRR